MRLFQNPYTQHIGCYALDSVELIYLMTKDEFIQTFGIAAFMTLPYLPHHRVR